MKFTSVMTELFRAAGIVFVLSAACLPAFAFEPDFVVTGRPDWDRVISQARRSSGGVSAAVKAIDALRESGPECRPGTLPGGVVDFVAGEIYEKAGRTKEALARYRAATASPLGDYAAWAVGRILESSGDIPGSRTAFGSISPASVLWPRARMKLATGLVSDGRPDAAVVVLRDLMNGELDHRTLGRVRLAMIDALAAAGQEEQAISLARLVYVSSTRNKDSAAGALSRLGRPVGPVLREISRTRASSRRDLKPACRHVKKRLSSRKNRSGSTPGLDHAIRSHCLLAVEKKPDEALKVIEKGFETATDEMVHAWLLTLKAEALIDSGDDAGAATVLARVVTDFALSPFAPEARHDGARALMREGAHDQATALLNLADKNIPPCGDFLNSSWTAALAALVDVRDDEATPSLDRILSATDLGNGFLFGIAERAAYFRALVHYRSGEREAAKQLLRRVAAGACCSWYGVLASSRLLEWFGEQPVVPVLPPDENGVSVGAPSDTGVDASDDFPGIRPGDESTAAVWLYRMGRVSAAESELSFKARRGQADADSMTLLALIRTGRGSARKALRAAGALRGPVTAENARIWQAAWPRPYSGHVADAAKAFDVDPALVWAVMRVESRFNHRARSPVGARGLMQLMPATAKTINGRILDSVGKKASYYGPRGNVMVGVALLDQLVTHFDGSLPLVLAGYNAGSGAARRFLRTLRHLETDLFVEALPYERTRHYIRKVAGHMAAYRYLYGQGNPLTVSFRMPEQTGPWLEGGESGPVIGGGSGRAGSVLRRQQ